MSSLVLYCGKQSAGPYKISNKSLWLNLHFNTPGRNGEETMHCYSNYGVRSAETNFL